jgi:hypothetical protein
MLFMGQNLDSKRDRAGMIPGPSFMLWFHFNESRVINRRFFWVYFLGLSGLVCACCGDLDKPRGLDRNFAPIVDWVAPNDALASRPSDSQKTGA